MLYLDFVSEISYIESGLCCNLTLLCNYLTFQGSIFFYTEVANGTGKKLITLLRALRAHF